MCHHEFWKRHFLIVFCCIFSSYAFAQTKTGAANSNTLDSVIVNAFRFKLKGQALPVSIAHIAANAFEKEINGTLLPAFNAMAGVRMEQRSIASYRLSIRGSSIRSPFGIRNVKVYWNDVPFSDPAGNTYINILPMPLFNSVDIIKGPVGAAYGLGTGGAVLIQSAIKTDSVLQTSAIVNLRAGSFGYFNQDLIVYMHAKNVKQTFFLSNEIADGWREQSGAAKKNITWLTEVVKKKHTLKSTLLYTDLMYQTPGGLTLLQMQQNPSWARQATPTLPSAVTQKTAVYNKTLLGSLHHNYQFSKNLAWQSFVVGATTNFKNPFITNYETRQERNISFGSHLIIRSQKPMADFQLVVGAEWQVQNANIHNYGNNKGVPDTLQFADQVRTKQGFIFANASVRVNKKWLLELGISDAYMRYHYYRSSNSVLPPQSKNNLGLLAPRLGISFEVSNNINTYVQLSKGFSPPTLSEIRPSDGLFYNNLLPEHGWNFEIGIKGTSLHNTLRYELAVYHFSIKDAIVRQNNSAGIEYFINAGSTRQAGVEVQLDYLIRFSNAHQLQFKFGYAFQPYLFVQYKQVGNVYDGNKITGNAKHQLASSITYNYKKRVSFFVQGQSLSRIPLTDANDVYAAAYQLVQSGISVNYNRYRYFMGLDNIFNSSYSLGNDINAAGKRYYNPSSPRSYIAGISAQLGCIRR
jgi:iron complex outermembrane receptor protein